MQLNKKNNNKNQINTIEQFKVLEHLKQFNTDEISLFLLDKFTIKLVDKKKKIGYLRFSSKTKAIEFYEK
ncbi:MAG: hypothetical protein HFJ02_03590 [Bacilli bacterium]|nr:hypothetical protein [Bacilli bacterium]